MFVKTLEFTLFDNSLEIARFEIFEEDFKREHPIKDAYRTGAQMTLYASISPYGISQFHPNGSGSAMDGILGQGTTIDLYFVQNWLVNQVIVRTS